jgi:hypothetical protein
MRTVVSFGERAIGFRHQEVVKSDDGDQWRANFGLNT